MIRLAALLHRTVDELGATMSSAELSEWMALEQEYGLPDAYFQTGMICSMVYNSWNKKTLSPADFCPILGAGTSDQTTADHARRFAALAAGGGNPTIPARRASEGDKPRTLTGS